LIFVLFAVKIITKARSALTKSFSQCCNRWRPHAFFSAVSRSPHQPGRELKLDCSRSRRSNRTCSCYSSNNKRSVSKTPGKKGSSI